MPPYIPPRRKDAPWVGVPIKGHATRVAPKITKGMTILHDILPNLVKIFFQDSNTSKISDLDRKNYMKLVIYTPKTPN